MGQSLAKLLVHLERPQKKEKENNNIHFTTLLKSRLRSIITQPLPLPVWSNSLTHLTYSEKTVDQIETLQLY